MGPRRLVANASEDQEVSLVENFLRSPIWGQHLSQAYLRGLSKGFDDVRAGERSQITDNFNHAAYAGAKEQFLDDIVRNTAPFSLRRIWNSYRPHIAANLPSQAAVLTLGRMAVLNAYTAGQLDAYQRLGVQLVNLRKNTSCNVTSGPVTIRNALNRLPHNPSCRCVWQPLRNQQPKKQRMLPASPLHTFSALLSGDLQVNATTSPLVWLVRHGETALNSSDHSKDRIRGWKDVPLNDDGLVEAKKLGEFFKEKPVAFLVASDLQRCRQTALTIAQEHNIKPMFTLALRPWNVGDYTGDLSSKVAPVLKKFAVQTPDKQIPNGESFNQFKARVLTYVELLLNQARDPKYNPTVIVSHFRVLKVVQAWIAAGMKGSGVRAVLDFDVFFQFKDLSTGGIFKLTEPNGDKWKLQIQTR